MNDSERQAAVYRIGAVAQLTGLPANTIRTWERRHGAVEPRRTEGGGRLYRDADVERLQLLKALCDRGESISAIARLSTDELVARLQSPAGPRAPRSGLEHVRVAVLHRTLGASLKQDRSGTWSVVSDAATVDGLLEETPEGPEVVVLELSLLGDAPEATYERCVEALSPEAVVVVYDFARQSLLEALADAGARLVRGPVETTRLQQLAIEQLDSVPQTRRPQAEEPPPPLYDDHQLARLRGIRSTVDCECPHHLAHLVETLIAFERYSAGCEDKSPGDAEIHRTLRIGTGRARLQMEDLLTQVLRWERITI